ncbi:MAG: RNA polymerase sigma factor [Bacteroidales bacterium]
MEKTGSKRIRITMPSVDNTVEELVILARNGNGTAFTALWDKHIAQLRMFIKTRMTINNDLDIDDICSRSFEKAFRQIQNYDPTKGLFQTWLKKIALNTALDLKAMEERFHPKNQTVYIDGESSRYGAVDFIPDQVPSPIDSLIQNENAEENKANIDRLPELYREVTKKRIIDGMQYKEIADELGLNENTVKTRISRAKVLLDKIHKENEQ